MNDTVKDTPDNNASVDNSVMQKKNAYTLHHAILAIFTLVLGSLWYRWVFDYSSRDIFGKLTAIPITVFTLIFFAGVLVFFKVRKAKINTDALIMLVSSLVFSLRFAIYPDDTGSTAAVLALLVLHVSVLLFLRCIANENTLDSIVGETASAVLIEPFSNFHTLFASFSAFFKLRKSSEESKEKAKKFGTELGLILLGVFITVPIALTVLSLLGSDSFFNSFIGDTLDFLSKIKLNFNIGSYFNIITVLVSLFIYGAVYSADKKRSMEKAPKQSYAFLPGTIINTVSTILLGVYLLFVLAQINGFTNMFTGNLPEGETYADFARSGFFELCAVACINGAVLFYSQLFRINNRNEKYDKILTHSIIGFTLFLIFTAAFKMGMYISAYGFTPKRFYTLWFMLLLTILFVMAIIKHIRPNFRLSRYSVYVSLCMLAILFLIDFEAISHNLNVSFGRIG